MNNDFHVLCNVQVNLRRPQLHSRGKVVIFSV